jgi:hypothetical protein
MHQISSTMWSQYDIMTSMAGEVKKIIGFILLFEFYADSKSVVNDLEIFYYLTICYIKKLLGSLLPIRYESLARNIFVEGYIQKEN